MSIETASRPTIKPIENFASKTEHISVPEEPLLSYDHTFDIDNYNPLQNLSGKEFRNKKRQLDLYTERQLVTNLGERYHVMLSTNFYDLKEGKLHGENTDEPFENMLIRGRNYRREHGNSVDYAREDAEVVGFLKMQDYMFDPTRKVGDMMVSISPQGEKRSSYQHNFYDVFILKEDEFGVYVEARRYSSALNRQEYALKASELDDRFSRKYVPTDAEFLAHPIKIDPKLFKKPEDVHRFFHIGHKYTTDEEFNYIVDSSAVFREEYIDALSTFPIDEDRVVLAFNAYLNRADEAQKEYKSGKREVIVYMNKNLIKQEVKRLGVQEVREETVGCGKSGAAKKKGAAKPWSPFSVSIFGQREDDEDEKVEWHTGKCVKCEVDEVLVGQCGLCQGCDLVFDIAESLAIPS